MSSRQSLDYRGGRTRGQNSQPRAIVHARPARPVARHRARRSRPAHREAGHPLCAKPAAACGVSVMVRAQRDFPRALRLPPGECLTLRPITPDDSDVLQAYVRGLSPESRYNRFFGALQELPPAELERVTHLDRRYDLALVAETDVGAVLGERIAWLDCMPFLALLLWPFRNVLPWDFQYLGLIFAFNCILQLYFGYRISWHLTGRSRSIAIAGALLFLVAPPFIFRSGGHFVLTSHWLILAALTLFFTAGGQPSKWRIMAGAAPCFLAASVHPYIVVMVLLIDAATHLRVATSVKETANTALGARLRLMGLRIGISL